MKFKFIASVFLTVAIAGCSAVPLRTPPKERSPSSELDVSCIGAASAEVFVIYLHGMDSVQPSPQEIVNRNILNQIAKTKNIRFALPRAQLKCPNQPESICWGWKFDQAELAAVLPQILQSRSTCFSQDKPFIILGFSNGGYLLAHWYSQAMMPSYSQRPISLVASGSGKGDIPSNITNLSQNPSLTLIIGKQDQFNFDPTQSLFHRLKDLKAPANLIEFDGGHILDENSLLKAFESAPQTLK